MKLVILCGGKGTRLDSITKKTPKPLIKFYDKPFIEHLINFYQKYNLEQIILLTAYKSKLFSIYHQKKFNNIECICVSEKKPKGTAGALLEIKNLIKKNFILVNGDSFLNYDLNNFIKKDLPKKILGKMILIKNKNYLSNLKLSNLNIKNKKIVFSLNKTKLMNSGIYFFNKSIFRFIEKSKAISLENEILPKLINEAKITGVLSDDYFIDIGLRKNLYLAKKNLGKYFLKPALFLDRDGTINADTGHPHKYKDLKWRKKFLNLLSKNIFLYYDIYIVTNQAGIAKGYYTEKDFLKLQSKIKVFLSNYKIYIKDVEFCPHHPSIRTRNYNIECNCRKPKNGMILNLKKKYGINLKKSILIGDQLNDKILANKNKILFFYSNEYSKIKIFFDKLLKY